MCNFNQMPIAKDAATEFATGPTSRSGKDPRNNATIGLLSGAAEALAQYSAGQDAGRIANENASLLRKSGKQAIKAGEVQAAAINRQARQVTGQQRAAFAGQGVSVESGSAADVQEETARLAGEDVARVRNNAALEAYGFKLRAYNEKQAGQAARRAGAFQAGSTLLGSAFQSGKFG